MSRQVITQWLSAQQRAWRLNCETHAPGRSTYLCYASCWSIDESQYHAGGLGKGTLPIDRVMQSEVLGGHQQREIMHLRPYCFGLPGGASWLGRLRPRSAPLRMAPSSPHPNRRHPHMKKELPDIVQHMFFKLDVRAVTRPTCGILPGPDLSLAESGAR